MRTQTHSKNYTTVATLILFGLMVAAGLAYWGMQTWDTFRSDYYTKGFQQEHEAVQPPSYDENTLRL